MLFWAVLDAPRVTISRMRFLRTSLCGTVKKFQENEESPSCLETIETTMSLIDARTSFALR